MKNIHEGGYIVKKFYTLEELSQVYEDYSLADAEAKKVLKKVKKYPIGFQCLEEAEALQGGQWKEYFEKKVVPFETNADAVVFADGSLDEKIMEGAYGLVIFFKDGDIYYESACLEDIAPGKYKTIRYSVTGEREEIETEYKDIFAGENVAEKAHGYVAASNQIGGECDGVMRAMEICIKERGLKKIVIAYDCENVETVWRTGKANTNVTCRYAKLCEEVKTVYGADVDWKKVDSHTGKKLDKPQYLLSDEVYPLAVYNDIVDAMAKAETAGKKIGSAENFNLARAVLPEALLPFYDAGATTREKRRAYARKLLETVLGNELLRPIFKA